MTDAGYVHGSSAIEQGRLTRMQALVNDAELGALELAGVRSILDVGAGLGQFTRAMARAAGPGARVVGVERDPRQLAEAARQAAQAGEAGLVEFRAGAAEALPLAPEELGGFELAHARFLLEHVADPLAVVREMVRAVRPGGRLVLVDDDHELLRLWPPCPAVEHAWRAYWESYADRGRDPLVGRRLAALLVEGGARPTRVTSIFYGAVAGMASFDAVVDNLIGVIEGAADAVAGTGRASRSELDLGRRALDVWRSSASATVWYSLPLAEGVR